MMRSIVPEGVSDPWRVESFEISKEDEKRANLQAAIGGMQGRPVRPVSAGQYTRLKRHGHVIMSDTEAEQTDHRYWLMKAEGRVLVMGLGLGLVVQHLIANPKVHRITVIEICHQVAELVWPSMQSLATPDVTIKLIAGDALTWKAEPGTGFDAVWADIWDGICTDNLKDVTKLKRKRYIQRSKHVAFWCHREAQRLKAVGW